MRRAFRFPAAPMGVRPEVGGRWLFISASLGSNFPLAVFSRPATMLALRALGFFIATPSGDGASNLEDVPPPPRDDARRLKKAAVC